MKVIVTGSTGYIGREILLQCLSCSLITSVVAISRRNPGIVHAKLSIVLHDNFSCYPSTILSQIQDAQACIYCLGTNIPVKPPELNRKINFEYAMSTATIFASFNHTQPFHFAYLSGALPERDPEKRIWFLAENRKMRGELENALLGLNLEKRDSGFKVLIARPGFVQPQGAILRTWVVGSIASAIMLPDLAAAMVHLALKGNKDPLVENKELKLVAKQDH
jgi:nucleoside-diphosphate-sugar epimerase